MLSKFRLFTHNIIETWSESVQLHFMRSPTTCMQASGIPGHLSIVSKLADLEKEQTSMKRKLEDNVIALREDMMNKLPKLISDTILGEQSQINALNKYLEYIPGIALICCI